MSAILAIADGFVAQVTLKLHDTFNGIVLDIFQLGHGGLTCFHRISLFQEMLGTK